MTELHSRRSMLRQVNLPIQVALAVGLVVILLMPPLLPRHVAVNLSYERPSNYLEAYYAETAEADTLFFTRFLRTSLHSITIEDDYREYNRMKGYTSEDYYLRYNPLAPPRRDWVYIADLHGDAKKEIAYVSYDNDSNRLYIAGARSAHIQRSVYLPVHGKVFYNQLNYFQRPNDDLLYISVVTKLGSGLFSTTLFSYHFQDDELTSLFSEDHMFQSYMFHGFENYILLIENLSTTVFYGIAYDLDHQASFRFEFPKVCPDNFVTSHINTQTYPYDDKNHHLFFRDAERQLYFVDLDSLFVHHKMVKEKIPYHYSDERPWRIRFANEEVLICTQTDKAKGNTLVKYCFENRKFKKIKQFRGASVGDVVYYGDIDKNGQNDVVYIDMRLGQESVCLQEEGRFFDVLRFPLSRERLSIKNAVLLNKSLIFHSKGIQHRLKHYGRNPLLYLRWLVYLLILALAYFIGFVIKQTRENRHLRQSEVDSQILQLQLENIQKRIDPHFIFNSLNNLGALILEGKTNDSYDYLSKVSGVLYKALRNRNVLITIDEELSFCTSVLETQRQRFGYKFDYELFVDKGIDLQSKLPSNILNSMVDNCIKHAFADIAYSGMINIEVLKEKEGFTVVVEDNGKGRSAAKAAKDKHQSTGTGLDICYQYVELFNFGRKMNFLSFVIEDLYTADQKPSGTRCLFYVPNDLKCRKEH